MINLTTSNKKEMNAATTSDIERFDSRWKTISIDDQKYSIRAVETDGSWKISLTDLIEIWTERIDGPAILKKCEELNPTLSIEDIDVCQLVRQLLLDLPKHTNKVSVERLDLSMELEGGIFYFAIDLGRGSARQLWEEVNMPICLAAGELRRRHTILLELVKAKDEEISEYKLNGAELVRKHIETEPFCNDLFKKNLPTQNATSCQIDFQTIMELHAEIKMERFSIKTESTEKCSAEPTDTREETVIIEVEENSGLKKIDLVADRGGTSKSEGKLTSVVPKSDIIVPKVETNSSPELTKASKSIIEIDKESCNIPKRARSARSLPAKRTKKSIHDFIT